MLGISLSEITTNGMDKDIQINEEIFTNNNFASQQRPIFVHS